MTDPNHSNPSQPLERTCLRDRVRNHLLERITSGYYAPGDRLLELTLAREFEVSQAPVREALRELEAVGVVQSERYRGTRVRGVDSNQLHESCEMRATLEERAAQLAVPCSKLTLRQMKDALTRMHQAASAAQPTAYARASILFHRTLIDASGNPLFLQTWNNLHLEVLGPVAAFNLPGCLEQYATRHDRILEALQQGQGQEAGRLLRRMIEDFLEHLKHVQRPDQPR